MTIATIYISDMHLFTHGLNIQPNSDHRHALAKRLDRQLTQFKPITAVYLCIYDSDSITYAHTADIAIDISQALPQTQHTNLTECFTAVTQQIITDLAHGRDTAGYPAIFPEAAQIIKDAANWQCENCQKPHHPPSGHTLTTHHLNGDKSDCTPENLIALCQRCHLRIQHQYTPGQQWLFSPPEWATKRKLTTAVTEVVTRP